MLNRIKLTYAMGEYCINAPWSYAPCREFWWLAIGAFAATLVTISILVFAEKRWRIHVMRRESQRLTREYLESQKRVADEETMRRFAWKGDGIVAPDKDQGQLTAEIRDALRSRKING
jgi:hypothetical protein